MGETIIRIEGRAGRITLNRPDQLNALSYQMILDIEKALIAWEGDPAVDLVLVDGAGARAFCAGGDIEDMYRKGRAGDFSYGPKFWRDEYRLNAYIGSYKKPYVALMNGFVMGGGVGVSAHGSHRVVSDHSQVAMPECAIGLIPDVGGTHLLGRAPGSLGEFAGLTGHRMAAADAINMGFADHYVPGDALDGLTRVLSETGDIAKIEDFEKSAGDSALAGLEAEIDPVFRLESVGDIMAALKETEAEWAAQARKAMGRGAPLSLICALQLVREARRLDSLEEALELEFRYTSRSAEHGEFLEGIRAAIIDKDRKPLWRYPSLEDVPDAVVAFMLAPVEA
ncbi:MAG: enoyl-CoA hydratase/isomerase family protein [Pseudomonadota bacterium]